MCVSIDEYHSSGRQCRRCPTTGSSRAAASARRQENRVTIRTVSSNVRTQMGPAAASSVATLAPSLLSNLMVSLEAVSPGVSAKLLRSPSGGLRRVPGMHNDVFSERREQSGAAAELNRGKLDPMAVTRVQLASALCERDLVAGGAIADPLEAAIELERIETRIDAIASGAITAPAGATFSELPERVQNFYRRHTLDELGALTAVSQRMSDRLFEDVTEQAQVAAEPRPVSARVAAMAADRDRPLTIADVLSTSSDTAIGIDIAQGVRLIAGPGGAPVVTVEGMRLAVEPDARIDDVVGRIPAVDFTAIPEGSNASGLNVAVQSVLSGESARARSMQTAARRRIIERTFYGDTSMSYAAGPAGGAHLMAGKARAHTASRLASRAHSSRHGADAEADTARIEGFELARHLRFARDARQEFIDTRIPAEMRAHRSPEAKLKRYAGKVSVEDRAAAARAGFRIRHRANTIDADYPGAKRNLSIDWDGTEPMSTTPTGQAVCPEHADVRAAGSALVVSANEVARSGRNPELAGSDALVAEAKLSSAFAVYLAVRNRDQTPRVLTAAHPVPATYRGREADFIADAFPAGGAFSTSGYTLARTDGAVRGGRGRVRVRYCTSDGMPISGGYVIDAGTTFRVIDATIAADGTVEVRAVADQVAAAAAAGKTVAS
jgi:hypothetical protein